MKLITRLFIVLLLGVGSAYADTAKVVYDLTTGDSKKIDPAFVQIRHRMVGLVTDIGTEWIDPAFRAPVNPVTGQILLPVGVPGQGDLGSDCR